MQISAGLLAFIVSRYILLAVEEVDSFIHLFRFHVIIRKNFSAAWREQELKLFYCFTSFRQHGAPRQSADWRVTSGCELWTEDIRDIRDIRDMNQNIKYKIEI